MQNCSKLQKAQDAKYYMEEPKKQASAKSYLNVTNFQPNKVISSVLIQERSGCTSG